MDAERRLPDDLVQDLAGAGLFRMAVPREEGGGGAGLLTVLRTIEAVSRADGSTGWCVAMGVNTFRHSAQFSAPVRRELFASDPVGVSAGSSTPRGVALAVPGG